MQIMKTILVVDDDSRMVKLLNMYLAPVYKVCSAKGGSIAIEFLKNHKPDLIILDYKMPGLDGPATFDIIKGMDGCDKIPVIFLTGVTNKHLIKECMDKKPAGYLVKPVAREELLAKAGEILEKFID